MTEKMVQFNARRREDQDDDLYYLCSTEDRARCQMDRDVFDESPRIIELEEKKKDPEFRQRYRRIVQGRKRRKKR